MAAGSCRIHDFKFPFCKIRFYRQPITGIFYLVNRLKWEDVDFDAKMIRLKTRKTDGGAWREDWLPMADQLERSLRWQWNNRKSHEWVFVSEHKGGHRGHPFTYRRTFMRSICERAGVKPFGFHALRRFVASQMDKHKTSTRVIQEVLRHRNITVTDRYVQRVREDLREDLNGIFSEQKKPEYPSEYPGRSDESL